MSDIHKPTAWDEGHAQLPPNYAVSRRLLWVKTGASLKPLCSINHRPCLHTLPIRKVRAPFHRIIQLHQKRFVLLVNVLDSKQQKWQIALRERESTFPMSPERLASCRRWDDDRALLIATQQLYRASMPTTYHYNNWPNKWILAQCVVGFVNYEWLNHGNAFNYNQFDKNNSKWSNNTIMQHSCWNKFRWL